ncbi:hypothetical protein [Glycomyces tritici]|uniref:Uncharacterized protein n=1 Tax=Glycomyces tritici TaxID=2665176 RepID=A0ABT7YWU7_9ACTN|nr:hypothetical protein [Glycomyces tritici]MDN3242688.1 hypothetical protein [Glycomyces tritici]
MSEHDEVSLPDGYPDPEVVGWARTEELEFAGLHMRMTITPGDRIVQLWELVDGHPVRWLGNVFRVESEPPVLKLNYRYEAHFSRAQRDVLARTGAKFWKS